MAPIGRSSRAGLVLFAAALGLGDGGDLRAAQHLAPRPTMVQDTAVAAQDTAVADTLAPAPTFPSFPPSIGRGPALARSWELGDILAEGALTPADLLEFSPLMDPVRAGVLEGPQAEVFAGAGAVGLRYAVDGYEIAPIEGGPLDLHLLPLVELQRLQLMRTAGGYLLSSESYRNTRSEPYSRIEAGTGQDDANVIRAFFAGRFAGGTLGFGFDRFDTDGQSGLGSAERTVVWADYARSLPGGMWGELEVRNTSADRDSFPAANRTDWIVRLRRSLGAGWYADIVGGDASVERTPVSLAGVPDSLVDEPRKLGARQVALRAGHASDWLRVLGAVRHWDGDGVPTLESEGTVDVTAGPLDVSLNGRWADWEVFDTYAGHGALTLRLPLGLRLLADAEDGGRGLFGGVPIARQFFTRVSAGAELGVGRWRIGGRGGRWRVDPSPTLGLPFDSAGAPLTGGTVSVVEGWVSGPVLRVFGGEVAGNVHIARREEGPFLYWPEEGWRLAGVYHLAGVHGQLDIWLRTSGGVRGALLVPGDDTVPGGIVSTGELSWFRGEVMIRVRDVHLYYNYEYFDAATVLGDLPAFGLPQRRYHFGVRWEFWN